MLRNIISYTLIGIGFLGLGYFRSYHGNLIPVPFLWFILSIVILGIGIFFSLLFKRKKVIADSESQLSQLKSNGEKIILDIEFCEFKTNDFQEIVDSIKLSGIQMYDALYNEAYNYTTADRNQTVIIYSHKNEKFVSPIFSIDEITIQARIMQRLAILYVDKFERTKFYFELGS